MNEVLAWHAVAVFAVAGVILELIDASRHPGPAEVIATLLITGPLGAVAYGARRAA